MKALTIHAVGTFGGSPINQVAAYDAKAQLVYAWLATHGGTVERLHAMRAKTGELLPTRGFQPGTIVDDVSVDATGRAYGAVLNMTAGPPKVKWAEFFAEFDLAGPAAIGYKAVGGAETFGVASVGAGSMTSCAAGTTPGAAKACYRQLNNGLVGGGTFFVTGFPSGGSLNETILGVDVKTGAVVLEHLHHGGMLVDMAYTSADWLAF